MPEMTLSDRINKDWINVSLNQMKLNDFIKWLDTKPKITNNQKKIIENITTQLNNLRTY